VVSAVFKTVGCAFAAAGSIPASSDPYRRQSRPDMKESLRFFFKIKTIRNGVI